MAITVTKPQVIIKNGRLYAVILDIQKYERLLEIVEDKEDLAELKRIKKTKTSFRDLDAYLLNRV